MGLLPKVVVMVCIVQPTVEEVSFIVVGTPPTVTVMDDIVGPVGYMIFTVS